MGTPNKRFRAVLVLPLTPAVLISSLIAVASHAGGLATAGSSSEVDVDVATVKKAMCTVHDKTQARHLDELIRLHRLASGAYLAAPSLSMLTIEATPTNQGATP